MKDRISHEFGKEPCRYHGNNRENRKRMNKTLARFASVLSWGVLGVACAFGAPTTTIFSLNTGVAGVTTGTMSGGRPNLDRTGNLVGGATSRSFAAQTFTPSSTGSYTFGVGSASFDAVLVVYQGTFNPANAGTNAVGFNDDSDGRPPAGSTVTIVGCDGDPDLCPQLTSTLNANTPYTVVVTTYNASSYSVVPVSFYVFGEPVAVGGAAPAPPPLEITPLAPMTLSVVPNQSLLGTGTATVVANQRGTWTATTSTPWLSLTQSIGAFPGVVAGIANAAGLAAGSYTGSISVAGTSPGGTQTITLPVTLTVNSPAALTANPTAISMASSYPAGSATGYTIQTGAPGLAFIAATSASSAGWLTVSPTSGIAPTPITVTLDPSKAIPGIYTDSIVVSSPGVASVSIPVKMSVSGIIATLPQQVNAGTAAGPDHTVAPNEIVSLYLTNFSCATAPVVSINGTAVSWSSYVAGQINYAVPANITSPAALTVACNGTTAWTFNGLTTAAVVPGIFTLTGTGKGQAAIVNSDGTTNSSTTPATRGSWLSVYGTGFGVFNEAGTNGLRTVAGNVTATIGGVDATVIYAGNTPGATDGLQQFNLQIPAGVTAGTAVPIVLTVNGTPTQTTATVSLK